MNSTLEYLRLVDMIPSLTDRKEIDDAIGSMHTWNFRHNVEVFGVRMREALFAEKLKNQQARLACEPLFPFLRTTLEEKKQSWVAKYKLSERVLWAVRLNGSAHYLAGYHRGREDVISPQLEYTPKKLHALLLSEDQDKVTVADAMEKLGNTVTFISLPLDELLGEYEKQREVK